MNGDVQDYDNLEERKLRIAQKFEDGEIGKEEYYREMIELLVEENMKVSCTL